jgi:PPM family protein phosphatase
MSTISLEQKSVRLTVNERTQKGRRKNNQDTAINIEVVAGHVYLVGVADGMGGYAGGEQASAIAKKHIVEFAESIRNQVPDSDSKAIRFLRSRILDVFDNIQHDIQNTAAIEPTLSQMGTTLVLACVAGRNFFVANIGDSRAYFLYKDREGRDVLQRITEDSDPRPAPQHPFQPGTLAPRTCCRTCFPGRRRGCSPDLQ